MGVWRSQRRKREWRDAVSLRTIITGLSIAHEGDARLPYGDASAELRQARLSRSALSPWWHSFVKGLQIGMAKFALLRNDARPLKLLKMYQKTTGFCYNALFSQNNTVALH
jgi:hypothetical protein